MLTRAARSNSHAVALKLGPGQGKSYIILMMVMELIAHAGRNIYIVVPTESLKQQFNFYMKFVGSKDRVNVIMAKEIAYTPGEKPIYFVDEADHCIDKHLFFPEDEKEWFHLNGLIAMYKAYMIFFFSGTYNRLCEDILKFCFGVVHGDILKLPTKS